MRSVPEKNIKNNCQGSVMLEYVLMLTVAIVFIYFSRTIFEPGIGFTEDIGKPMVAYFQRVLTGISLPIP